MKKLPYNIINHSKNECCGCNACAQKCPKHCIIMETDEQGFLYPKIDVEQCKGCLLCENVCPALTKSDSRKPLVDYAIINDDSLIRGKSSSGGVFYLLAKQVIEKEGIVFGAMYNDNFDVIHCKQDSSDGIKMFMGSKYSQSLIKDSFIDIERLLKLGKTVYFAGTPCQVSGLKKYLKCEYENLITQDCICHGVPSPKVWSKYLKEVSRGKKISNVNFRDKREGWYNYHLTVIDDKNEVIYSRVNSDDPYLQLFINNYSLRPSCNNCPSKCGRSGSDITLGDFWRCDIEMLDVYDGQGTTLVMANTEKGKYWIESITARIKREVNHERAIQYNPAWNSCYELPKAHDEFFEKLDRKSIAYLYKYYLHPERLLKNRLKLKLASILYCLKGLYK